MDPSELKEIKELAKWAWCTSGLLGNKKQFLIQLRCKLREYNVTDHPILIQKVENFLCSDKCPKTWSEDLEMWADHRIKEFTKRTTSLRST